MNILDQIIAHKYKEVEKNRELAPVAFLEKSIHFNAPTLSLSDFVQDEKKSGIIAEFKRKSPSRSAINLKADAEEVSRGYSLGGASAISVLTDQNFFGGSKEDLNTVRKYNFIPVLRKDFIVSEYQILEAKSMGADAILLIAEVLEKSQVKKLGEFAKSLGLEVLFELHSEDQLHKLCPAIDLVGVNNRDLKTFQVSIEQSKRIGALIPNDFIKVSESGLSSPESIVELKFFGFQGFLIGETFMKTSRPGYACRKFIEAVNQVFIKENALCE
ncbi:indole-3-glycerol phosphate synthase TrpC [Xanthovirga aplysinae]|uniref:indole-3-glycerol phosphate synthase TrpC n=1 Tax=Xanthovirga aplysinae TaxID=2529853 RepID=UPI0012BD4373|nr:indole-3-glycerol phosphate synthase TrpC [Xanthovirga aplysinae]MTI31949.1 indole-3-glycerol phosphate synthase TrpC [Xanthovirga aplysinae]